MSLKFRGINEFSKALKDVASVGKVRNVVTQNTAELLSTAQRTSPVDTGFMRRSHSMNISRDGFEGTVGVGAEYANNVNEGTRYQNAQPWFTTSYNKQEPIFIRDMKKVFDEW